MPNVVDALKDFRAWSRLTADEIAAARMELARYVGVGLEWNGVVVGNTGVSIAAFQHHASGMTFHLIPGGTDLLGLSDAEYDAICDLDGAHLQTLDALRPATPIMMPPFLMSREPVLQATALRAIQLEKKRFRPDFQPLDFEKTDRIPVYLTRSETEAVVTYYGFSLPSEAQWEYAIRGGTDGPFFFGATLPTERTLAKILETDFRVVGPQATNPFGIVGMLVGGWCRDSLAAERWSGVDVGPPHVVRGGAAICWPWQNCGEWMLALSAMRCSGEDLAEGTCSAHVVLQPADG